MNENNLSAFYNIPSKCDSCGSDNIVLKVVVCSNNTLQTKYICDDCGYIRNLPKISHTARAPRNSSQENRWAKRAKDRMFCCQICGSTENLEVHHIIPVSCAKEFEFSDSNAIVLCKECHFKVHKNDYYNVRKREREELEPF